MRPATWDDSPEATAYRRAELARELAAMPPQKVWRRKADRQSRAKRDAAIAVRVEALRLQADRLEATIARHPTADERRAYVMAEWERLAPTRQRDELALSLGYPTLESLTRSLYRWGRPDLARLGTNTEASAA